MEYDYLIVGAGLFGCTFAHLATKHGKKCLVIDKREHVGGNTYCKDIGGIPVHVYGPHIFHTDNEELYKFITSLVKVEPFINSPMAHYKGKMYNLPFNMNTFNQMYGMILPSEVEEKLKAIRQSYPQPKNLEEKAVQQVGREIYAVLIKGYTEKQWGRPCSELPVSIINRIPVRLTYDNRYFQDRYQFIPVGGYNSLTEKLLEGSTVLLGENFFGMKGSWKEVAEKLVFTGRIDEFYDYKFGELEYRSLRFQRKRIVSVDNFQGVAVVNETDDRVPYTRVVEHKHFYPNADKVKGTVLTYEYPASVTETGEAFYPINDEKNSAIYQQYKTFAEKNEKGVIFGGRLAEYKYYDMDDVMIRAMELWKSESNR